MNRTFIRIGLMLLLSLFPLNSCIVEKDLEKDDAGAYVVLNISRDILEATKSYEASDTHENYEASIKSLRAFLASDKGEVLELEGVVFNEDVGKTNAVKVPLSMMSGNCLYVVANASTRTFELSSREAFLGSYETASLSDCGSLWADDNFLMSNVSNEIDEVDPDRGGVKIELSENNTRRNPLLVDVNLERVAAKIVPETASDIEYKPLGKTVVSRRGQYKVVGMQLDAAAPLNTAKSFNLIQKWEKASSWTDSSSGGEPRGYPELRCVSPSSSVTYQRENGYWHRMEEYVDYSTFLLKENLPFEPLESAPVIYCLENNSPYYDASGLPEVTSAQLESASHPTKMSGRTTGLLFRARVAVAWDAHISEPVTPDPDEGEWISRESISALPYKTFYRYDGLLYYDVDSILDDYPELSVSSSSSVSELRKSGVEVFEDGYCYYTYYIKDNNYTDDGLHQYSVLRNTRYNLTVKRILSVGYDIPGSLHYNGTDPVDMDRTQLEVIIKASDWTVNDVEHEIK